MTLKTITFSEACELVHTASAINIDGLFYVLRPRDPEADAMVLSLVTAENPMRVRFASRDNPAVRAVGASLFMQEEGGEEAQLGLHQLMDVEHARTSVFHTAETAAAITDAMHQEVCKQSEGSYSAWDELYEVAKHHGGFPTIWCWISEMAMGARGEREERWASGEDPDFIDSVGAAAQVLHNYLTDPATENEGKDNLSPAKVAELWELVDRNLAETHRVRTKYQQAAEIRRVLYELEHAASRRGYKHGKFIANDEGTCFTWTLHGGPHVEISRFPNGLWRVGCDVRTESPQPSGAFLLWRDYFDPQ